MTHAVRPTELQQLLAAAHRPLRPKAAARRGFLSWLFAAMHESRQRQADREIEAYLARTGGRFTDSIEREINERHFNGGWNPRR